MEQFQKKLVDYYESLLFQDDLKTWANAPRRSRALRQHIVFRMNSDLLALGSTVTAQDRERQKSFVSGAMSYEELQQFIRDYVTTIKAAYAA